MVIYTLPEICIGSHNIETRDEQKSQLPSEDETFLAFQPRRNNLSPNPDFLVLVYFDVVSVQIPISSPFCPFTSNINNQPFHISAFYFYTRFHHNYFIL